MFESIAKTLSAEEKVERFKFLLGHELGLSIKRAEMLAISIASVSALIFSVFAFLFGLNEIIIILGFVCTFAIAYLFSFFFFSFLTEQKQKEKEKNASVALIQASLLPEGTTAEQIVKELSRMHNPLAEEFKIALNEIRKGAETNSALENLAKRCNGKAIAKLVQLLKMADVTGGVTPAMLRESAKEIVDEQTLARERAALLTIQKATLVLSSMILVPFILGMLAGIAKNFDLSYLDVLELGKANQAALVETARLASNVYIVELVIIASLFLGMLENNTKKAIAYLLLILPVALSIFYFAVSTKIA